MQGRPTWVWTSLPQAHGFWVGPSEVTFQSPSALLKRGEMCTVELPNGFPQSPNFSLKLYKRESDGFTVLLSPAPYLTALFLLKAGCLNTLAVQLLTWAEALPCLPSPFISRTQSSQNWVLMPHFQPPGLPRGKVMFECPTKGFIWRTIQLKFQRLLAELNKQMQGL